MCCLLIERFDGGHYILRRSVIRLTSSPSLRLFLLFHSFSMSLDFFLHIL